jgi:hypothetical protein
VEKLREGPVRTACQFDFENPMSLCGAFRTNAGPAISVREIVSIVHGATGQSHLTTGLRINGRNCMVRRQPEDLFAPISKERSLPTRSAPTRFCTIASGENTHVLGVHPEWHADRALGLASHRSFSTSLSHTVLSRWHEMEEYALAAQCAR